MRVGSWGIALVLYSCRTRLPFMTSAVAGMDAAATVGERNGCEVGGGRFEKTKNGKVLRDF